jgi:ABC-type molybdate transport system substrate-binding protein
VKLSENKHLGLVLVVLALIPLVGCGGGSGVGGERNAPSSITVLADESLRDAFTRIGDRFERDTPGNNVEFTFGPSDEIAQTAMAGDAGDLLTTADRAIMDSTDKVQLDEPRIFARKGQATYAIATLLQSENSSLSQQFIDYVAGPSGQAILHESGFEAP